MGGEGLEDGPPFRVQVAGYAAEGRWPVEDDEGVAGRGGQAVAAMMTVITPRCTVCKQPGQLEVDERGWALWQSGAYIQDALPELDADQRELLISGTHAHCWERLFGGDDE